MMSMDLLMVAREAPGLAPTPREIDDPAKARQVLPTLPHGPQITPLLARLALGVLILARGLDRGAARAAIGVSIQRARPRAVVLLGHDLGRELLGEGLPLAGGIRDLHSRPMESLSLNFTKVTYNTVKMDDKNGTSKPDRAMWDLQAGKGA